MSAPPPTDLLNTQPLPSSITNTLYKSLQFVESNGWYILILSIILYYIYHTVSKKQYHNEVYSTERTQSLQEQMRLQRLKQQSSWSTHSKTIVEQSKIEKQIQQQQIAERRKQQHGRHRDGDSDSDNELIDLLGSAVAAKGGLINGKKRETDKKSGLSSAAFGKVTDSGVGKKWGSARQAPKSK